jgi:hypothetical protein
MSWRTETENSKLSRGRVQSQTIAAFIDARALELDTPREVKKQFKTKR